MDRHKDDKLGTPWSEKIWLGTSEISDEHLCGCNHGNLGSCRSAADFAARSQFRPWKLRVRQRNPVSVNKWSPLCFHSRLRAQQVKTSKANH